MTEENIRDKIISVIERILEDSRSQWASHEEEESGINRYCDQITEIISTHPTTSLPTDEEIEKEIEEYITELRTNSNDSSIRIGRNERKHLELLTAIHLKHQKELHKKEDEIKQLTVVIERMEKQHNVVIKELDDKTMKDETVTSLLEQLQSYQQREEIDDLNTISLRRKIERMENEQKAQQERLLEDFSLQLRMDLGLYYMYTPKDAKQWAKRFLTALLKEEGGKYE